MSITVLHINQLNIYALNSTKSAD